MVFARAIIILFFKIYTEIESFNYIIKHSINFPWLRLQIMTRLLIYYTIYKKVKQIKLTCNIICNDKITETEKKVNIVKFESKKWKRGSDVAIHHQTLLF